MKINAINGRMTRACKNCLEALRPPYMQCPECGEHTVTDIWVPEGTLFATPGHENDIKEVAAALKAVTIAKGVACSLCLGQMRYKTMKGRGWRCEECGCETGFGKGVVPNNDKSLPPEGTLLVTAGNECHQLSATRCPECLSSIVAMTDEGEYQCVECDDYVYRGTLEGRPEGTLWTTTGDEVRRLFKTRCGNCLHDHADHDNARCAECEEQWWLRSRDVPEGILWATTGEPV